MILRNDKGELPAKTKIISTIVALSFCVAASSIFKYENSEFCINIPQWVYTFTNYARVKCALVSFYLQCIVL